MARFYFHLRSPQKSLVDCDGMMLADAEAARQEAIRTVQNFFQPAAGRVHPEWEDWSIDVSDQRGRRVFSMAFADAAQAVAPIEPAPAQPTRSVVYLDIARAKREFSSVEDQMRKLVNRTSTLVERTRYEAKNIFQLMQEAQQIRQTSQELLDRSRRQVPVGDWFIAEERVGGITRGNGAAGARAT